MSERKSPSTGRRYSIQRVCAVWQISRSTVHEQLRRQVLDVLYAPRKRGPVGAATDEDLVDDLLVFDQLVLPPLVDSESFGHVLCWERAYEGPHDADAIVFSGQGTCFSSRVGWHRSSASILAT